MVFNETEKQENEYLQWLIGLVNEMLCHTDTSVKEHVDTLQEYKEYLWSNKDIDPHEIRSMRESILNHFALGESVIDKCRRLSKILDIPYFGRIDFKEKNEGSKTISTYIGIHTLYDTQSKANLIYDWRAPVSGMFYDYELGEAFYSSPAGEIEGEVLLKRQYHIRKGKLEYMIESSLTIHDDILQKELSFHADEKMKNIVTTIQREQNRIIRNEEAHVLIIQGVAGSGKTSIALHRIAYLLYAMKGDISSRDILIISPNKVFADYISNVLPELGEETVPEISMEQILSGILDHKFKYQNFFEQVSELLEKPAQGFVERIRYKSSFDFISQLDRFILYVENNYFKATDIQLTRHITIPAECIEEQFKRFNRYPMRRRFEPMADYIFELTTIQYRSIITTAEKNLLKKEIKKMFMGNYDIQVYKDFFEWIGRPELFKMRKNHTLEYTDLVPLAYLHLALDGNLAQSRVKHLLIDEMQDYSPIQYRVIQKLYTCRKTILGDICQSVSPNSSSTADMIRRAFTVGKVMKLCKSYRSTFEITDFAQKIQINEELEPIMRHGQSPKVLQFKSIEEEISGIGVLISTFKISIYRSLGIVCKTETQAKALAQKLQMYFEDIYLLSSLSSTFVKGVVVTSAHMAKGLEFDEVIVPQVEDKNYNSAIDKSMLYVAVTRAMHKLTLTYSGSRSEFVPESLGK